METADVFHPKGYEEHGHHEQERRTASQLLEFKPKNVTEKDENWVRDVGVFGLEAKLAMDFEEWLKNKKDQGKWFGTLEVDFAMQNGDTEDFNAYAKYVAEHIRGYSPTDLGLFGEWMHETEVEDQSVLYEAAIEYMNRLRH